MKETWAVLSPLAAYDLLKEGDVEVTNKKDKTKQLPKVLALGYGKSYAEKHEAWEKELRKRRQSAGDAASSMRASAPEEAAENAQMLINGSAAGYDKDHNGSRPAAMRLTALHRHWYCRRTRHLALRENIDILIVCVKIVSQYYGILYSPKILLIVIPGDLSEMWASSAAVGRNPNRRRLQPPWPMHAPCIITTLAVQGERDAAGGGARDALSPSPRGIRQRRQRRGALLAPPWALSLRR